MNIKMLKAGILICLLVVPALFFVFLKSFGDNTFSLPYYFPELDESGHVQIQNGDTVFHKIPNFNLTNQSGGQTKLSDFSSKIKLVNFFFSRCGTICPIMNKNLSRVQEGFKGDSDVVLLSITVDPEYDTDSVLNIYARGLNDLNGNWHFLTGDKTFIYDLANKEFKLPVSDASMYDSGVTDIDQAFIHSEKVLLLDTENKIRGIYDATDEEEIDRLRLEIKVLKNILNE